MPKARRRRRRRLSTSPLRTRKPAEFGSIDTARRPAQAGLLVLWPVWPRLQSSLRGAKETVTDVWSPRDSGFLLTLRGQLVKRILLLAVSLTVLGSMLLSGYPRAAKPAHAWMRVPGEATWRKAEAAPARWRAGQLPSSAVSRLSFRQLPLERVQEMHERNRRDVLKRTQVGIARSTGADAMQGALPRLQWAASADGAAARIEVRSPGAAGMRVGLRLESMDDRVELRFAGSD